MEEINSIVCKALDRIEAAHIYYFYPSEFTQTPIITYREASNIINLSGDDKEYTSEIETQIDLYCDTVEELIKYSREIDIELSKEGFSRQMSSDLYDPSMKKHKTMRYKIII